MRSGSSAARSIPIHRRPSRCRARRPAGARARASLARAGAGAAASRERRRPRRAPLRDGGAGRRGRGRASSSRTSRWKTTARRSPSTRSTARAARAIVDTGRCSSSPAPTRFGTSRLEGLPRLLDRCHFVVVSRPGTLGRLALQARLPELADRMREPPCRMPPEPSIFLVDAPTAPVSSTDSPAPAAADGSSARRSGAGGRRGLHRTTAVSTDCIRSPTRSA